MITVDLRQMSSPPLSKVATMPVSGSAASDRERRPELARDQVVKSSGQGAGQAWPAFSRAEQQVPISRRVTTYGSTFAFGRRSSM